MRWPLWRQRVPKRCCPGSYSSWNSFAPWTAALAMKREMPLYYTGPDGLIYTVYFEHNENVDAGSPLIGICPPDQLQQIEEVVLKVQTEWQEQE